MDWLKEGFAKLFGLTLQNQLDLFRIQAAKYYLHGVKTLRGVVVAVVLAVFAVATLAAALGLIPIALCLFMPWEPLTKAIVCISIAGVYIVVAVAMMAALLSERRWMKLFKVSEVLERVLRQRE